ncbi:zinc-ribbon domain-containing protein [Actibacterium sp. MT2.3-13A]|uniref:zinc-ribbon domain-containing protein n=1 Tax=Actibacterium sp. MT2.3-13A TaxID=2828332 RepID=UPI001BABF9E9|nr:zinc-ribbon domain-containing protein [Actibacterium sp. MT2.3-13A]
MRLVCPNCDAQYEVDDALIPAGGRDVQCSNCGHTWFQRAAGEPEPEAEEMAWAEGIAEEPDYEEEAEAAPEPEAEPAPEEAPGPRRQVLDESLAEILREEAERERRARETEAQAGTWEEQPDLGLDETTPAPGRQRPEPQEHVARLRGIEPERAEAGPRRDLLPDIEEINYTLRSTSERKRAGAPEGAEAEETAPDRGGFGRGFSLVVVLAAMALAAYVLAPQIAEQVPQLKPVLNGYTEAVDRMRIGLEVVTNLLIEKIAALTG